VTSSDHDHRFAAPTTRLVLLCALVVVLLASLATSAWLVTTRGAEVVGIQGDAAELQQERDAVMSQSRQFMLRVGTFGPDQLEDGKLREHRELVSEVITEKFRTSFDREVVAAEQLVQQAGVERSAEVFATGVVTLDDDSATTLVAGTFTDSYPDRQGDLKPQDPVQLRWEVSLVRTGGEWLVDDFAPASGGDS
jgi:hypothetical protein